MALDPRTLMACIGTVALLTGVTLLVYRHSQRTFPGFRLWVVSTFCVAAAYASIVFRTAVPFVLSTALNNVLFTVAAVLRLDGIGLFFRGKGINRFVYAVPVVVAGAAVWATSVTDSLAMRVGAQGVASIIISVATTVLLLRSTRPRRGGLVGIMVGTNVLAALSLAGRIVGWLVTPAPSVFDSSPVQSIHLLLMMIFEICWCLIIMMLNARRLDAELRESQSELKATVAYLEQALSSVNTLSGLLPICSCCKKVRDDRGYWSQIETYISSHSDAQFSHGLCPECARRLYPDLDR